MDYGYWTDHEQVVMACGHYIGRRRCRNELFNYEDVEEDTLWSYYVDPSDVFYVSILKNAVFKISHLLSDYFFGKYVFLLLQNAVVVSYRDPNKVLCRRCYSFVAQIVGGPYRFIKSDILRA